MAGEDFSITLKKIRIKNLHRIIIAHININSIRNKFDFLFDAISENIDVLLISETKLDSSFPKAQFYVKGYTEPYRLDRNKNGGGIMIYIREDIPSKLLSNTNMNIESLFVELNVRNKKWLISGSYNPHSNSISTHLKLISNSLDLLLVHYDNLICMGDFNVEETEPSMLEFCQLYNLKHLIKMPTCFKNPENPRCIDLILTNCNKSFQCSNVIETGLSDFHKMVITVMKTKYPKQTPKIINYRNYKKFVNENFREDIISKMLPNDSMTIVLEKVRYSLKCHAPKKKRYVRANQVPYMTKELHKMVMTRSRLRNKFIKDKTMESKIAYNRQRNICVSSFRKEKIKYFSNMNIKKVTDNKSFWKAVKPAFSEKGVTMNNKTLIENDEIIYSDEGVSKVFNDFFSNLVNELNIPRNTVELLNTEDIQDPVLKSIRKYSTHPSIVVINESINEKSIFKFQLVSIDEVENEISSLDVNKSCQENDIPTRVIKENSDIFAHIIFHDLNSCIVNSLFPDDLKLADVIPVFKKGDKTLKSNYRPVSILPKISKVYERCLFKQMNLFFENILSKYQCGFRKGASVQHCLLLMIEKWKKSMDDKKSFGALLTDLSKAFDCLVHDLLIAKLHAYGFTIPSLKLINSYLTNRKQRVKINNEYSSWSNILLGVPQGSILGPLLFNIYMCDMFFHIGKIDIIGYADDNTPYLTDVNCSSIVENLQSSAGEMSKWFNQNYMLLNADKCHLLLTGPEKSTQTMRLGAKVINSSDGGTLLGFFIDTKLTFESHILRLCEKASQKIHALSRISPYIDFWKKKILMKAFIMSQFSYCPLIWMLHSRKIENTINRIHERALRLVYGANNNSFEELLEKDSSVSIHQRNLQCLAVEMFKVLKGVAPEIMNEIFQFKEPCSYGTRNYSEFKRTNVRTVTYGENSISHLGPKIWDLVPIEMKSLDSVSQFKFAIKSWKPVNCPCRICKTYISQVGFI